MKTSNRSVLRRISANMFRVQWCSLPLSVLCFLGFSFWISCAVADCWYNDENHEEGTEVPTAEPCLNCTCSRSTLLCYLRVCPKLPNPPPPGCILLHRYKTCCPELICTDSFEGSNGLEARSEPDELELLLNDPMVGNACVVNGSVYGPGSAMDSSSFCEYCYCLRGKQICVKPKCLLPIEGCVPMYEDTNCCPVHYNCSYGGTTTSSTTTIKTNEVELNKGGCLVDGVFYKEGGKVLGIGYSVCDNCYCLRGILRCEPLSCAPPLLGCSPVVRPGECCAASYNCSGTIEIQPEPNYGDFPIISKEYAKLRKEVQSNTVTLPPVKNQRTHGAGTTRHFAGSSFNSSTVVPFFHNSVTTKLSQTSVKNLGDYYAEESESRNTNSLLENEQDSLLDDRLNRGIETETTTETSTDTTTTFDSFSSTEEFMTESTFYEETTESTTDFTEVPTTTSSYPITVKTVLNSTDCTNLNQKSDNIDLAETTTVDATNKTEAIDVTFYNTTPSYIKDLEGQGTSIFPRNTTKSPIDLEVIYNISKTKDSDYDYDYSEPSLPPSLPNLRIIPFVAADALDLENEKHNIIHPSPEQRVTDVSHGYNLFSPPVETEGGFIPKQPPILDNLYEDITTTSTTMAPQLHEVSCILEEQEIGHGESIVSETTCNTCACFYGNIICQKTVCPIPILDCQKSLVQEPMCCPHYICDNEPPAVVLDRLDPPLKPPETVTVADGVNTPDPFKDVIRTEPAPNLQSLIVDMMPFLTRKTTPTTSKTNLTTTTESSLSFDKVLQLLFSNEEDTPTTTTTTTTTSRTKTTQEPTTPTDTTTSDYDHLGDLHSNKADSSSSSVGILKLAGCNIYGRMYRVGRIISELSNPCLECKCTEIGVQCRALQC